MRPFSLALIVCSFSFASAEQYIDNGPHSVLRALSACLFDAGDGRLGSGATILLQRHTAHRRNVHPPLAADTGVARPLPSPWPELQGELRAVAPAKATATQRVRSRLLLCLFLCLLAACVWECVWPVRLLCILGVSLLSPEKARWLAWSWCQTPRRESVHSETPAQPPLLPVLCSEQGRVGRLFVEMPPPAHAGESPTADWSAPVTSETGEVSFVASLRRSTTEAFSVRLELATSELTPLAAVAVSPACDVTGQQQDLCLEVVTAASPGICGERVATLALDAGGSLSLIALCGTPLLVLSTAPCGGVLEILSPAAPPPQAAGPLGDGRPDAVRFATARRPVGEGGRLGGSVEIGIAAEQGGNIDEALAVMLVLAAVAFEISGPRTR